MKTNKEKWYNILLRGIHVTCCSFQVDGSLTMNILSVLFAFIGIIILSVSLAGLHPASEQCKESKPPKPTQYHYYHHPFEVDNDCSTPKAVLTVSISKDCIESF